MWRCGIWSDTMKQKTDVQKAVERAKEIRNRMKAEVERIRKEKEKTPPIDGG